MSSVPRPTRLSRFASLSSDERRLWVACWIRLLVADLELRLAPAGALRAALATPPAPPASPADRATAIAIARTVASAAAHHLWPMPCLPRSLALWRLLRARGITARLQIGVRRLGPAAHAWVEVAGVPVGEPEGIEARFLRLTDASGGQEVARQESRAASTAAGQCAKRTIK